MRHRRTRTGLVAAVLTAVFVVGACGESGGDGPGDATPVPAQDRVVVTPETIDQSFRLARGNYRVGWTTTGCSSLTVKIAGDTGYARERTSAVPNFSWILTSVTEGTYQLAQTNADCTTWEIVIERMGSGGGG